MQAMILAAGLGTRLRPYTGLKPKPLFPVLNTPLLVATVHRLQDDGFSRIIVNAHHLAEQVHDALAPVAGVIVQQEDRILGTGGGLREACDKLDDEPLLVVNGDIYHTIDCRALYRHHRGSGHDITMAVHDFPRFNNVSIHADQVLHFHGRPEDSSSVAYTGVQVVNPDLLAGIKKSSASCIIEYYRSLLADGKSVHIRREDGCFWTDMGTPEDYLNLHRDLLAGTAPRWPELACRARQFCVDPAAVHAGQVSLQDWAAVGKAHIGEAATLARCVVWDGAVIAPGARLADQIVVPESAA